MRIAFFLLSLCFIVLLTGCSSGPVMTSGTQGVDKSQLAVIRVKQHGCLHEWNGAAIHIDRFLVGQVAYAVGEQSDFFVSPGWHTFNVDYGRCVHGSGSVEDEGFFTGPYGEFKADIQPGAEYLLVGEDKLSGENGAKMVHELKRVKVIRQIDAAH